MTPFKCYIKLFLIIQYLREGNINSVKNSLFTQLLQEHMQESLIHCEETNCPCKDYFNEIKYDNISDNPYVKFSAKMDYLNNEGLNDNSENNDKSFYFILLLYSEKYLKLFPTNSDIVLLVSNLYTYYFQNQYKSLFENMKLNLSIGKEFQLF